MKERVKTDYSVVPVLFLFLCCMLAASSVYGKDSTDEPAVLPVIQQRIKAVFEKLNQDMVTAAQTLSAISENDYRGPEARNALRKLCGDHSFAVDCSIVDTRGKMVTVEPGHYRKHEGADISGQAQVIKVQQTKKPVMSSTFRAVEGFDAVDIEYPLLSAQGEFRGAASILIRPALLLSRVITLAIDRIPVEPFVMDTSGRILYDPNEEEVGRMLFSDPIYAGYPSLLRLGEKIAAAGEGSGSYQFIGHGSKKVVEKVAHWRSVSLYGTDWRIVLSHVSVAAPSGGAARSSYMEDLRKFGKNKELLASMARGDTKAVTTLFKAFYESHPGLYSVQWTDVTGVNRAGYPEENSLVGFDFKSRRVSDAEQFLEAIKAEKEKVYESNLIEGEKGRFFLVPVYPGGDYLGLLYIITLVSP